jgi:hypothetical protein
MHITTSKYIILTYFFWLFFWLSYSFFISTSPSSLGFSEAIFGVLSIFIVVIVLIIKQFRYDSLLFTLSTACFILLYLFIGILSFPKGVFRDFTFIFYFVFPFLLLGINNSKLISERVFIFILGVSGFILAFRNVYVYILNYTELKFNIGRISFDYLGSDPVVLFAISVFLLLLTHSKFVFRLFGFFSLLVIFTSLALDGYRGGIAIFSFLTISFLLFKKKYLISLLLIGLFFSFIQDSVFMSSVLHKFEVAGSNGRVEEVTYILSSLGGSIPWFGLGIGAESYTPLLDGYSHIQHSMLSYLVVRFGVFGILFFLFILYLLAKSFIRGIQNHDILLTGLVVSLGYFSILQAGFKRLDLGILFVLLIFLFKVSTYRGAVKW